MVVELRPLELRVLAAGDRVAELVDLPRGVFADLPENKSLVLLKILDQIVHDFGRSISPDIDTGQIEGAVMQGIGWMTLEEIRYDDKGKLLADSLSTYKIPDLFSAPGIVECKALDAEGPGLALLHRTLAGTGWPDAFRTMA